MTRAPSWSSSPAASELLAELAASLPVPTTWVAADLTDADAPEKVRAHLEEHHDRLDLLVNNAGAGWRGSFADTGWENVHRHMELNFDAAVRLTEALLPLLHRSIRARSSTSPAPPAGSAAPNRAPTRRASSR